MSAEVEVDEILSEDEIGKVPEQEAAGGEDMSESESSRVLDLAVTEAKRLFSATGASLADVCTAVEAASSPTELQEALGRLNQIMHIFLELQTVDIEAADRPQRRWFSPF